MRKRDYYGILGVRSTASADEIKSAYRDLVKRYHPDLFSTAATKARANEKLQPINDAYAILGDPKRRRQYDEQRFQKGAALREAPKSTPRRPSRARKKFARPWTRSVSYKWMACTLGVVIFGFLAHATWKEPEETTAWMLWEKTVIEPSRSLSGRELGARDWTSLGRFSSRSQCAASLKTMVKRDEQRGSKAILDEGNGTIAIAVHIRDEEFLTEEYFKAALKQTRDRGVTNQSEGDQQLLKQRAREEAREFINNHGIAKHVTNYECRETGILKHESLLRRIIRGIGLLV